MYAHQRLMYYELRRFLENPPDGCKIAVLTGIRRIGKTGVLTDLSESLPGTKYVNFSRSRDAKAELSACLEFLKAGRGILLIDEITHYPNYETLVENIEYNVYNNGKDLRVVFTGSSSLHLLGLKSGLLGAGRAKLFRMSFLSFAEYLVFTGRKADYSFAGVSGLTSDDFKNYFLLKDLSAEGLKISFDHAYMSELYRDIALSNQSSRNPGEFSDITEEDILCVLDLVAYTIGNLTSWPVFNNPDGTRELIPLEVTDIDRKSLRIYLTAKQLKGIVPVNIARALYYLIVSNLAYVEVKYDDPNKVSASKLARQLFDITTREELFNIFTRHNICLVNPMWYMRIAGEIVEQYGFSPAQLLDTRVIGEVLENYVKGAYCRWQAYQFEYEISEIGSVKGARTNEERGKSVEVDICDARKRLLCEVTAYNKRREDVNLMKHFQDEDYIRILSTKDIDKYDYGTYKIPYPKLCAMVDTGEVFGLIRSKNTRF